MRVSDWLFKSLKRSEREFCSDHAHLHRNHHWCNGVEPGQGASLLGVPNAFEDTGKKMEHHMKFIDELVTAARPSAFTLPAVS